MARLAAEKERKRAAAPAFVYDLTDDLVTGKPTKSAAAASAKQPRAPIAFASSRAVAAPAAAPAPDSDLADEASASDDVHESRNAGIAAAALAFPNATVAGTRVVKKFVTPGATRGAGVRVVPAIAAPVAPAATTVAAAPASEAPPPSEFDEEDASRDGAEDPDAALLAALAADAARAKAAVRAGAITKKKVPMPLAVAYADAALHLISLTPVTYYNPKEKGMGAYAAVVTDTTRAAGAFAIQVRGTAATTGRPDVDLKTKQLKTGAYDPATVLINLHPDDAAALLRFETALLSRFGPSVLFKAFNTETEARLALATVKHGVQPLGGSGSSDKNNAASNKRGPGSSAGGGAPTWLSLRLFGYGPDAYNPVHEEASTGGTYVASASWRPHVRTSKGFVPPFPSEVARIFEQETGETGVLETTPLTGADGMPLTVTSSAPGGDKTARVVQAAYTPGHIRKGDAIVAAIVPKLDFRNGKFSFFYKARVLFFEHVPVKAPYAPDVKVHDVYGAIEDEDDDAMLAAAAAAEAAAFKAAASTSAAGGPRLLITASKPLAIEDAGGGGAAEGDNDDEEAIAAAAEIEAAAAASAHA